MKPDDALRERVLRLSARGVNAALVHELVGQHYSLSRFQKIFSKELKRGSAEADAAVSEALFDVTVSGKSPPLMLAWAKQRLGWSASEDDANEAFSGNDKKAAEALATLQALLDQLADRKTESILCSSELAEGCKEQSDSTTQKHR